MNHLIFDRTLIAQSFLLWSKKLCEGISAKTRLWLRLHCSSLETLVQRMRIKSLDQFRQDVLIKGGWV